MIFYNIDTETTGLDYVNCDIIELSIIRLSDKIQKTWNIKAINEQAIQLAALKVNGHKLEDITWKTKEGKEKYLEPSKAIVEIENWIMEDNLPPMDRVIVGHNSGFDRIFLEMLWKKCNCSDSFPFGHRIIDTMQIEIMMDLISNEMLDMKSENYSQNSCIKKYGIKNDKAHTAAADVLANMQLFEAQIKKLKGMLK